MLMRLMSKGEYLIVPKGTKFMGSGKLGLRGQKSKCVIFSKFSNGYFSYKLHSMAMRLMHNDKLDPLYKNYNLKFLFWVIWGYRSQKVHFHNKCIISMLHSISM